MNAAIKAKPTPDTHGSEVTTDACNDSQLTAWKTKHAFIDFSNATEGTDVQQLVVYILADTSLHSLPLHVYNHAHTPFRPHRSTPNPPPSRMHGESTTMKILRVVLSWHRKRLYLEGQSQLHPMTETCKLQITVHITVSVARAAAMHSGALEVCVNNEAKGSKVI